MLLPILHLKKKMFSKWNRNFYFTGLTNLIYLFGISSSVLVPLNYIITESHLVSIIKKKNLSKNYKNQSKYYSKSKNMQSKNTELG